MISPIVIQELIQYLIDIFPEIHYKLTYPYSFKRDAFSYYLSGHCYSFAKILLAIFPNNSFCYISSKHIIVKIDDYFYDIRGILLDINFNLYYKANKDSYYINFFDNSSILEKKLEELLIDYGKIKLKEILNLDNKKLNF